MKPLAAVAVCLIAVAAVAAEDKEKAGKLDGLYARTVNDVKITFDFKKETMTVTVAPSADTKLTVDAKYTLKGNVVSGEVTKVVTKGDVHAPPEGEKFTFKVDTKPAGFVLKELDVPGADDAAKALYEGEYKKEARKPD